MRRKRTRNRREEEEEEKEETVSDLELLHANKGKEEDEKDHRPNQCEHRGHAGTKTCPLHISPAPRDVERT